MIKRIDKKINNRQIFLNSFESEKEVVDFIGSNSISKPISIAIIGDIDAILNYYSGFLKKLLQNQVKNVAILNNERMEDEIDRLITQEGLEKDKSVIMTTNFENLEELIDWVILSVSVDAITDYESCLFIIFPDSVKLEQLENKINSL